jgi:hypothetical protein
MNVISRTFLYNDEEVKYEYVQPISGMATMTCNHRYFTENFPTGETEMNTLCFLFNENKLHFLHFFARLSSSLTGGGA